MVLVPKGHREAISFLSVLLYLKYQASSGLNARPSLIYLRELFLVQFVVCVFLLIFWGIGGLVSLDQWRFSIIFR